MKGALSDQIQLIAGVPSSYQTGELTGPERPGSRTIGLCHKVFRGMESSFVERISTFSVDSPESDPCQEKRGCRADKDTQFEGSIDMMV